MWQEGADLSLDELVAFTASGPGTLPVSGVGGPPDKRSCVRVCASVRARVCVCVSRPSGLKLLLNARPRNDTDTVPWSRAARARLSPLARPASCLLLLLLLFIPLPPLPPPFFIRLPGVCLPDERSAAAAATTAIRRQVWAWMIVFNIIHFQGGNREKKRVQLWETRPV